MSVDVEQETEILEAMTLSELRSRYAELFGEMTRGRHRQSLIRRILWRLQALEQGDLSQRARRRAAELANDADLRLQPPRRTSKRPPVDHHEQTENGPPSEPRRAPARTRRAKAALPAPGTVLTRPYKGRLIEVTVLEHGFAYQAEHFATLSGLAKRITGSHWNGFHFFGLTRRENNTP